MDLTQLVSVQYWEQGKPVENVYITYIPNMG